MTAYPREFEIEISERSLVYLSYAENRHLQDCWQRFREELIDVGYTVHERVDCQRMVRIAKCVQR